MHPGWIAPALLAIPFFAVTNADDLVLLTIFFSNPRARAATIVVGQLIGIGALTFAWCGLAANIVRHPRRGEKTRSLAGRAAPYVFIGVGVWILAKHTAIQRLFT